MPSPRKGREDIHDFLRGSTNKTLYELAESLE